MIDKLQGGGLTLVAFAVVLGIIIFVHEFGHFIVAKLFRMRVFIFSFGFGKRLFGFRRGDTDYRVSLVPLGGYVKLEGEADDFLSESTAQEGDGKDFLTRPRWQRFLVYVAGPLMNGVLAVVVYSSFYMIGVYEPSEFQSRPIIGEVIAGTPAQRAGIESGDEVVAIDGKSVSKWDDLLKNVGFAPERVLRFRLKRADALREIEVRPAAVGPDRMGQIGVAQMVYILALAPGWPAERAGVRAGDGLISVNGKTVRSVEALAALVTAAGEQPVAMRIYREGRVLDIAVPPENRGQGLQIGVQKIDYQLVWRRLGPVAALRAGAEQTRKLTVIVLDILGRLVRGQISFRTMGGPIRIAQESGRAVREGGGQYFGLIAFLSVNVGVLNLLPLVPLDGGHLLVLLVESIRRRDLSMAVKTWLMNAGAIIVFVLIGFVLYSDLSKTPWFSRFLP